MFVRSKDGCLVKKIVRNISESFGKSIKFGVPR